MINPASSPTHRVEAHHEQREQLPESHLPGTVVQATPPSLEHRQIKESALDHFMQMIGNPVKTITSIPDQIQSAFEKQELLKKLKNERDLFYMMQSEGSSRRGLERELNTVLEAYNHAFDSHLAPGTQEAIEHSTRAYAAALNHAINESLKNTRLQEIKQKKESHFRKKTAYLHSGLRDHFANFMSACDAILSTGVFDEDAYTLFTSTEEALSKAYDDVQAATIRRRREELENRRNQPGAFHISAGEAAAQGIFPTTDAPHVRRIETPEATPLPETNGTPLDSSNENRSIAVKKALQKKVPVVEAEVPMMWVHGIPAADAAVVDATEN